MDDLKKYIQQHQQQIVDDEMPNKQVWSKIQSTLNAQQHLSFGENNLPTPNKFLLLIKYAVAACVVGLAVVGAFHLFKPNSLVVEPTAVAKNDTSASKNYTTNYDTTPAIIDADTPLHVLQGVAKKVIAAIGNNNSINEDTIKALISIANNSNNYKQVHSIDSQFAQVINFQKNTINNTPIYAENAAYFNSFITDFKQIEKDEKRLKFDIIKNGMNAELVEQLINIYQQKINVLKAFQAEINKTNNRFKQNREEVDTAQSYYVNI